MAREELEKEVYNLCLDKTELEDILEAINCYFMCDMSVQCVEMQEEEHEREKRIKNLSEKLNALLEQRKALEKMKSEGNTFRSRLAGKIGVTKQ